VTFFLILALVSAGLAIACAWADTPSPAEREPFEDIHHCHIVEKEPSRP